jgi:hypothetical protein
MPANGSQYSGEGKLIEAVVLGDPNKTVIPAVCDALGRLYVDAVISGGSGAIVQIEDTAGNPLTSVSGSLNVNVTNPSGLDTVNQGNAGTQPWLVDVTNFPTTQPVSGTVTVLQGTSPWVTSVAFPASLPVTQDTTPWIVNGSGYTQPVSGSVSVSGNVTVVQPIGTDLHTVIDSGSVSVSNFPATQPISGSVSVSNFPATQNVSGTVTALQGTSPWVVSGTITTSPNVNVHDGSGNSIGSTSGSLNVDVTNTVPVTLASTTITGNVTVIQPTGSNLHVDVDNFPTTQPISGTVTALQGTSPWVVSGTVTANAGTGTFQTNVTNASIPVTQSGTWNLNNITGTISLPTGAATSANQTNASQKTQIVDGSGNVVGPLTVVNSVDYLPVVSAPIDGLKATYSAGVTSVSSAALATDIFTITGSATKLIRVLQVLISGYRSVSSAIPIRLDKRSTANTGGTPLTVTSCPHDSNDPSATALVQAYSTNPTTGVLVAVIRSQEMFLNTQATGQSDVIDWEFGLLPGKAIVLRGTSQVLAVNLGGLTITGGTFDFFITWTEE